MIAVISLLVEEIEEVEGEVPVSESRFPSASYVQPWVAELLVALVKRSSGS